MGGLADLPQHNPRAPECSGKSLVKEGPVFCFCFFRGARMRASRKKKKTNQDVAGGSRYVLAAPRPRGEAENGKRRFPFFV